MKNQQIYNIPSATYFESAISHLRELTGVTRVLVFSDNISEAKVIVPQGDHFVGSLLLPSPGETLIAMSRGKGLVASNSTFSWWAGFLSGHSEVVIPENWTKVGQNPFERLRVPGWLDWRL